MTALAVGGLMSSLSLGGCVTSSGGTSPMDARAQAPAPKAGDYSPIQGDPPERDQPVMTPSEQSKLRSELIAARDRQAKGPKGQKAPAKPQPVKP